MERPSTLELMTALGSYVKQDTHSDFTVVCRGRTYPVHRSMLCARSEFFDGLCRNPFREAESGLIDLSQDDPEAVEHMVNYFYNLDYLPVSKTHRDRSFSIESSVSDQLQPPSLIATPSSPRSPASPLTPTLLPQRRRLNLALVEDPLLATAAANQPRKPISPYLSRFGKHSPLASPTERHVLAVQAPQAPMPVIDTMIREDAQCTGSYFAIGEDSVPEQETDRQHANLSVHARVYAIAEKYGIKGLKALAKKKYAAQIAYHRDSDDFAPSLAEVYEGTIESDRGLREVVISVFRHFPELAQRRDVEDIARDTPQLAWELFRIAWGLPV